MGCGEALALQGFIIPPRVVENAIVGGYKPAGL